MNKYVILDEVTLKIVANRKGDTILFDYKGKTMLFAKKFLQGTYQILKVKQ